MKKSDLIKFAIMGACAFDGLYDVRSLSNPYCKRSTEYKDTKTLQEYTWKGHKVMAYSKTDAKNRIKAMLQQSKQSDK